MIGKKRYRVVTNGEWYEIEYSYKWWPFWSRITPSRYRTRVDNTKYKFDSLAEALKRKNELEMLDDNNSFEPVDKNMISAVEDYQKGLISREKCREKLGLP